MSSAGDSEATRVEEEVSLEATSAEANDADHNSDANEDPEISVADNPDSSQAQERTEELEKHLGQNPDQNERVIKLPLTRIKHIIKMDPDVTLASQEAVVTIAKAAELFISAISKDASFKTVQAKRRTVVRKDLDHVMDTRDCYAFLEGTMES